MKYHVIQSGESRSFPAGHALITSGADSGDVAVIMGSDAGRAFQSLPHADGYRAVLVELGAESLGSHTGESRGDEGSNVLGFARFRLGDAAPSDLVELVRQPRTAQTAIDAARALFEACGDPACAPARRARVAKQRKN